MKGKDIIMFGLQPWDIPIGSNFKNMALEIAKNNRVLYVNRPLDRASLYRNKNNSQIQSRIKSLKTGEGLFENPVPNLTTFNPRVVLESINWLPDNFIYDYFNRKNGKRLAGEINRAAGKLGFKNYWLLIDNDFFNGQYLSEYLQPAKFVHYIRDFLLSQHYFQKHGPKAETSIMKKADGVAANSLYLANYASQFNQVVADIGQGCDVEDFMHVTSQQPLDVINIPKPRIGYCGSITSTRLDIRLLEFIASQRPEWQIVLVGPEDEKFRESGLHKMKNVHFTGGKNPEELPAYVHSFDVCINPQVLNQMTIGNYPRKVDEYLAAGKPVVATRTEAMEAFDPECILCSTDSEYLAGIERALAEQHDQNKIFKRKELASSHTWEASVNKLYQLCKKIEDGK